MVCGKLKWCDEVCRYGRLKCVGTVSLGGVMKCVGRTSQYQVLRWCDEVCRQNVSVSSGWCGGPLQHLTLLQVCNTQVHHVKHLLSRVDQNRIHTPYMTEYLAIFLPKIPYVRRVYIYGSGQPYFLSHPPNSMLLLSLVPASICVAASGY